MVRSKNSSEFKGFARAPLRRLVKPGMERRASMAIAATWLTLWLVIGFGIKLTLETWKGFFWGLILSGIAAVGGIWLLYVKPVARRKNAAKLVMENHSLIVLTEDGEETSRIILDSPHRAMLVRAKSEARVLLRVEQVDENFRSRERIDLFGPLPMVLPMRISGDARSLIGFEPGIARKDEESSPFEIAQTGVTADSTMTEILKYIEAHGEFRTQILNLEVQNGQVRLDENGFLLITDEEETSYNFDNDYSIECFAKKYDASAQESEYPDTAEIYVAVVPEGDLSKALVFQRFAPDYWLDELPSSWDIPLSAMERRILLYDDTPGAFVAVKALKRYIEKADPSNRVLEILRY